VTSYIACFYPVIFFFEKEAKNLPPFIKIEGELRWSPVIFKCVHPVLIASREKTDET
jgi:hypothetical protein